MSDKPNPFREGMNAAAEGTPERANPYRRGTPNWTRWLGGHRNAQELTRQKAGKARQLQGACAQ